MNIICLFLFFEDKIEIKNLVTFFQCCKTIWENRFLMNALKNIFNDFSKNDDEEFIEKILSSKDFKLERIISEGHNSPPNFWYDQDKNEFVLLLKGKAELSFYNGEKYELNPGDYMIIHAHQRHRVDWTDPDQKTFWLTIHY